MKNKNLREDELYNLRKETVGEVYNILCKCLGEPPEKFTWNYLDDDENHISIKNATPISFRDTILPGVNFTEDFVVITNIPPETGLKYGKVYQITNTNNVEEGKNCIFYNTDIEDIIKYAKMTIDMGLGVWFVGDVSRGFDHYHSILDDNLCNPEIVFGKNKKFTKGERILLRNIEGSHAMCLTGYSEKPSYWQVENSWGYIDSDVPGLDGFLCASDDWLRKYCTQIVVPKSILSRSLLKKLNSKPVDINPWDYIAPALYVKGVKPIISFRK